MSISKSKSEFNKLFERKYNAKPIQLELEFNEDINEVKSKSNDDFDKGIDKIVDFTMDED